MKPWIKRTLFSSLVASLDCLRPPVPRIRQ